MNRDEYFMKEAIRLSIEAVRHGNEPFGSVLVKDDKEVFNVDIGIIESVDLHYDISASGVLERSFVVAPGASMASTLVCTVRRSFSKSL